MEPTSHLLREMFKSQAWDCLKTYLEEEAHQMEQGLIRSPLYSEADRATFLETRAQAEAYRKVVSDAFQARMKIYAESYDEQRSRNNA